MLTALVVDDESDARRRVADLLRLGGWQVREAAGADDALRQAALDDPDLVVTDVSMPGSSGPDDAPPAAPQRLAAPASSSSPPTRRPAVRAEAAAAGALACWPSRSRPRVLLDFLRSRTTGLAAQDDTSRPSRSRSRTGRPARRRPRRRAHGAAAGDVRRRAARPALRHRRRRPVRRHRWPSPSAAHTLAGTSGQLGHPEVADVCRAIAADARRGVLAHARVVELRSSGRCTEPRDWEPPRDGGPRRAGPEDSLRTAGGAPRSRGTAPGAVSGGHRVLADSLAESGRLTCGCSRKVVCVGGKARGHGHRENGHDQQEPHLANSSTARKVVGSLGVLGTAAAVAGMGTFGNFTDSTTPVATTIQSGTLSIDLSQPGFAVPVTTTGFVPGDSLTRAVNLVNDGNSALGSVTLILVGHRLQRADHRRHQRPAADGEEVLGRVDPGRHRLGGHLHLLAAPRPSSAPARSSTTSTLNGAAALNAGGTDYLTFSISLPATADNTFQGKSASLSLDLHGHPAHRHRPLIRPDDLRRSRHDRRPPRPPPGGSQRAAPGWGTRAS